MDISYIDTHAHLNLGVFNDDWREVAGKCTDEKVAIFNVGTKLSTSEKAMAIAKEADNCYAIIGLHPIQTTQLDHDEDEIGEGGTPFTSKGEQFDTDAFRELAQHEKVIAIGETGFDYYHNAVDTYDVQEAAFISQIELANELGLPLMIHTRGPQPGKESPTGRSVYEDVYEVLKQYAKVPFNVHFYAGTIPEAEKFLELGGTISFTGVITFAKDYAEVVKWAPLDRIHAETDCPFVSPVPYRGKRCEPWMMQEVAKKIAELKKLEEEEVRVQLQINAKQQYSVRL